MTMNPADEQEIQMQKDIKYLTRTLVPDNLDADIMFAKGRGIRSCTPPFDTHPVNSKVVRERLKRVQPPPAE
jgi:hypothetical protein